MSEFSSELVSDFSFRRKGGYFCALKRSRNLRSKTRFYTIEPSNSLESLVTDWIEEEYVYSSLPLPCTLSVRPLLVTDGSRIINKPSVNFKETCLRSGVPELQRLSWLEGNEALVASSEHSGNGKQSVVKEEKRRSSSFSTRASSGLSFSQGSNNGILVFFLGLTIGMIFVIAASKIEVTKLNELLRQTQNLHKDLQEELEMRDLATVKELNNEVLKFEDTNYGSLSNHIPKASSSELVQHTSFGCISSNDDPKVDNYEELSKIEAELEAELELLEQNINKSSLQRTSHYNEWDLGIETDVVRGDLRLDKVNWELSSIPDSDSSTRMTPTNHTDTANRVVSPQELSLHLYEVIESQLEARMMELEMELENSQKKLNSLKLENIIPEGDIYSHVHSSSSIQDGSKGVRGGSF